MDHTVLACQSMLCITKGVIPAAFSFSHTAISSS